MLLRKFFRNWMSSMMREDVFDSLEWAAILEEQTFCGIGCKDRQFKNTLYHLGQIAERISYINETSLQFESVEDGNVLFNIRRECQAYVMLVQALLSQGRRKIGGEQCNLIETTTFALSVVLRSTHGTIEDVALCVGEHTRAFRLILESERVS